MHHSNDNKPPLRFLSVCSGIEAASVAWPTWQAVAFSEIEKFPSAVLAHHYPDVPNLGDFTKINTATLGHVDILCGGTPCQAFSVAGLRKSLADDRGNLSLEFVRLAHELAGHGKTNGNGLRNVIWENVVGVLSTKDNAFGCFLAGLVGADAPIVPPGKWTRHGMVVGPKGRCAWAVKDAQFFGVAQRRRRVIVVADFGNGADPASVLFEPEGMFRHSPPSRETGEGIAPTISARTKGGGGLGTDFDLDGGLVEAAHPLLAKANSSHDSTKEIYAPEIARCVATREGSSQDYESTTMVAVTKAPEAAYAIQERAVSENPNNGPQGKGWQEGVAFTLEARNKVQAVCATGDITHTLKAERADASDDGTGRGTSIVAFQSKASATNSMNPSEIAPALDVGKCDGLAICCTAKDYGADAAIDVSPTLLSGGHDKSHANAGVMPAVTVALRGREGGATAELGGEVATALRASSGGGDKPHVLTSAVRRLTPVECERLQGFPDNYTAIPWRGKPADQCPDGPRYKALGNSWAVPLFAWLGRRIEAHMPAAVPAANDNNAEERTIAA